MMDVLLVSSPWLAAVCIGAVAFKMGWFTFRRVEAADTDRPFFRITWGRVSK